MSLSYLLLPCYVYVVSDYLSESGGNFLQQFFFLEVKKSVRKCKKRPLIFCAKEKVAHIDDKNSELE